jgi:hypothetical protein
MAVRGAACFAEQERTEGAVMANGAAWQSVDRLVLAAGGRDEQLAEAVDAVGAAAAADLVAAEIRLRCGAVDGVGDVAVNLNMRFQGESFPFTAAFKDGRIFLEPGTATERLADIQYELVDLARLVWPTRAGRMSTSRDVAVVTWPWTGSDDQYSPLWPDKVLDRKNLSAEKRSALGMKRMALLFRAVETVIAACERRADNLSELASLYGSDKWGALHWYTPHYEQHFAEIRYDPVRVLEIGIGGYSHEAQGGESLYMWQRFFPRGLICGMDLYAKPGVTGPRIRTIQGDQSDPDFLRDLGEREGPFDVIVDDGSHVNEHVLTSYKALFPYVRPGGYYVIEDLHTAYWPEFGGELPPGSAKTSTGFLKDLIDKLHLCEFADSETGAEVIGDFPADLAIYHNVAIMRKRAARERGIPAWVRQRSDLWISPSEGNK